MRAESRTKHTDSTPSFVSSNEHATIRFTYNRVLEPSHNATLTITKNNAMPQNKRRTNTYVKRVVKQHRLISHASKLDYLYLILVWGIHTKLFPLCVCCVFAVVRFFFSFHCWEKTMSAFLLLLFFSWISSPLHYGREMKWYEMLIEFSSIEFSAFWYVPYLCVVHIFYCTVRLIHILRSEHYFLRSRHTFLLKRIFKSKDNVCDRLIIASSKKYFFQYKLLSVLFESNGIQSIYARATRTPNSPNSPNLLFHKTAINFLFNNKCFPNIKPRIRHHVLKTWW